jgi:hypothetical protein
MLSIYAQRATRVGREAEADDRADIGLARIGDDAFLIGPGGFERLRDQQAVLQLFHVDQLGLELVPGELGEPGQRRFGPASG